MQLPYFFEKELNPANEQVVLSEDTSRHCAQVLRMKEGSRIQLVNGRGMVATAAMRIMHRKNAVAVIEEVQQHQPPARQIHIGISLLKNAGRLEWFMEKAAEIGVSAIHPLVCARTEKQHFRKDRFENILVAAMLQSRQYFLTKLSEPVRLQEFVTHCKISDKFIAHCESSAKKLLYAYCPVQNDCIMLIGPEGDFSPEEIGIALASGFNPVSLGETRLRTETAGLYSAVLMSL